MDTSTLDEVLEAAGRLTLDEQETLVEVLERRLIELRRQDIAREVRDGIAELEAGRVRPSGAKELLDEVY